MNPHRPPESDDSQFEQILADYLHAAEQGQPLDQNELLQRHPELAVELRSFFANRAALERLAGPLKSPALDETIGLTKQEEPAAGRVRYVGDYELVEEIARGGMGIVYKAQQKSLNRTVAVKMILAGQLADESAVRRFRQEAEAAAGLDHPHIVPVFEVGAHQDQHYFSMGYVDGPSLAKKIAAGPLPPREAAELMEKVARAVQYAHDRGVIHRDLKPSNVLVDRDGRPRVTDFGLAKLTQSEQSLTDTGQALGTPGYMPPEQVDGRTSGPQADVYGLGAILYSLLTGRPPFQAATAMETMLQVLAADPVPPRQLNPSVPRDLDTITRKCLEKWPAWRYATAKEVADDLQRFLQGEPIQARRSNLVDQGIRWFRKQSRSVAVAFGAVVATLLLAIFTISAWYWYQDWRLGRISLKSDRPPLVAEIIDEEGSRATPLFTVPTQEPVAVPAGEYDVRVATSGRLSKTYRATIPRGTLLNGSLNLEDQVLPTDYVGSRPMRLERSFALIKRKQRDDILFLSNTGLELLDWRDEEYRTSDTYKIFDVQLAKPTDPAFAKVPGLRWPWHDNTNYADWNDLVFHPRVMRHGPDLDRDGIEEVIVAAAHQAWILAISGKDGKVFWCTGRGVDALKGERRPEYASYSSRNGSSVLAEPIAVADMNGDTFGDLLAMFGDAGPTSNSAATRWLECISGLNGETIWRYDFPGEWFQIPIQNEWPWPARWHLEINGYSGGGGGSGSGGMYNDYTRGMSYEIPNGDWQGIPFPPEIIQIDNKSMAVICAGTRLLGIDIETGKPILEPLDLQRPLVRQPQLVDADGDGEPKLLAVQEVPDSSQAVIPGGPPPMAYGATGELEITLRKLTGDRQALWSHVVHAEYHRPQIKTSQLLQWPVLEDLDGDGKSEVIVPTNDVNSNLPTSGVGELEVLEGTTGQPRWRRRLKTMDRQLDYVIAGPDIDGDGQREVFIATLQSYQNDLYVDALSGATGDKLWWARQRMEGPSYIKRLQLWHAGSDGWPRILVHVAPDRDQFQPKLVLFSAGTGAISASAEGIHQLQIADLDHDQLNDLIVPQEGEIKILRGESSERWRRLGGNWQAASDFDGDGQTDLVAAIPQGYPEVAALSGRTGRQLWRTAIDAGPTFYQPKVVPLQQDLDGDGVHDVLAMQGEPGGASSPRSTFPLFALSGSTGRQLWGLDIEFSSPGGVPFAEAIDLEGDGTTEIVFNTWADWDYDRSRTLTSSNWRQHWLAAVDGKTGRFRWRKPLSVAYGLQGGPVLNDDLHYQDIRPAFFDVNSDRILDIVMPAEEPNKPGQYELRATSGKDGQTLWSRPYLWKTDTRSIWRHSTPPAIAVDLDLDGRTELVYLEYERGTGENNQEYRRAHLIAIEAATAKERWRWHEEVDYRFDFMGTDENKEDYKPRPLVLHRKGKQPLIAFWVSHPQQPGKVVLIDSKGTTVAEFAIRREGGSYRAWAHDLNGDGNEEVILLARAENPSKLVALEVQEEDSEISLQPLWSWPIANANLMRIVDILPATSSLPVVVAVQRNETIFGISGTNCQPLWTNSGPQPRTASNQFQPVNVQLLGSTAANPPAAIFQWDGQLSACREAVLVDPGSAKSSVSLVAARTTAVDPRTTRQLSWSIDRDRARDLRALVWSVLLSGSLVLLPGAMLYSMLFYRRWSLRTLLALPLLAGLMIVMLRIPPLVGGDPHFTGSISARVSMAFFATPPLVFAGLLVYLARQQRWRPIAVWLGVALVFAALITSLAISKASAYMNPGDRLAFGDWDIPLAVGFYCASIPAMFYVAWLWLPWPRRTTIKKS